MYMICIVRHKINWNALPENDSLLPLSAWRAYNVSSSFQHIFDHRDEE